MPRKPKRQAAARSPRRRRNKHGGCLIFVILFVIIGLGMFLAAHKKNNPDLTWPDKLFAHTHPSRFNYLQFSYFSIFYTTYLSLSKCIKFFIVLFFQNLCDIFHI